MKMLMLAALAVVLFLPSMAVAQSLTPPQRANLRTARNATIDAKSHVDRLEYFSAQIKAQGSQTSTKIIQDFNASVKQVEESFLKAKEAAAALPQDNEDVKAILTEMGDVARRYQAAVKQANDTMNAANQAVADAGGVEAIQKDVERLSEIAGQFSQYVALLPNSPEEALVILQDFRPAVQEVQGFETKYAEFLKQQNADTAAIQQKLADAKRMLQRVVTASQENLQPLLDSASRNLDTTEEMIQTGVEERRPMYFAENGGVKQHLDNAKHSIKLAHAISAEAATAAGQRYDQVEQQAKAAGQTLKADIIAANKGPTKGYVGSDTDDLKQQAAAAWREANPSDEVVDVVITTPQWNRETKWTWWRDAFYYTDRSTLQASVIIKGKGEDGSDELHFFPVDITKDHENNDALKFSPWTKESLEEMPVRWRMLPENWKA